MRKHLYVVKSMAKQGGVMFALLAGLLLSIGTPSAAAADTGGYKLTVMHGQSYQLLNPVDPNVTVITGAHKAESYYLYGNKVDIGFDFRFFGRTYRHLYFSCNGYLQFTPDSEMADYHYDGSGLLNPDQPNNLLAPLWGQKLTTFV